MRSVQVVYSLNQIAYLMLLGFTPKFKSDNNKLWFAVFMNSPELQAALEDWKQEDLQLPIHDYLTIYKQLRDKLNELRVTRYGNDKSN